MIKNEERLYHVIVSFPSICAKEFLILKIKRNEAICCLIGFGIGLSCCLVYRWFRNNIFISTNNITNKESSLPVLSENNESKLLGTKTSGGLLLRKNHNRLKHRHQHQQQQQQQQKHNQIRNNSSTSSSSNVSLLATTNCSCCCCCCSSSNNSSNKTNNLDLNDIYKNLTNFLNKQFYRNIKLKNHYRNHNHSVNKSKLNKSNSNNNNNLPSFTSSPLPSSSSKSNIIKTNNLNKHLVLNQSMEKYLDLKYEINNCSSRSSISTTNNNNNKVKSTSQDNVNNSSKHHLSSMSSSYFENSFNNIITTPNNSNNNNINNASSITDEIGFEIFANSSNRSSLFDFDDISDTKYPNQRSDYFVDQSLDEALNQINKLKEDMTNLCEDIDSLYNTKSTLTPSTNNNNNNNTNNNNIIRLDYLNESNEYEDTDDQNSFFFKCDCVYSNSFNKILKQNRFNKKQQQQQQQQRSLLNNKRHICVRNNFKRVLM